MAEKRQDDVTGVDFVGHEWDGIEELNNPLPRWWVWTFYATIVFAIGYCIAYPAWPLVHQATAGVLGWSSRGVLASDMKAADAVRSEAVKGIMDMPIQNVPQNEPMMRSAIAGGRAAFKVNCVQCHGEGAAGGNGYPNLNDDDWLWGGSLPAIEQTITDGIRDPADPATRNSLMPAFGRDGILTSAQVSQVSDYVLSLSGKAQASAAGAEIFQANCAICHGADGKGLREFGAPDLTDAIWLNTSTPGRMTKGQVMDVVINSRHGVMPAWKGRLDPVTIRMLALYVHSLGGGEDFVEPVAQENAQSAPAEGASEQP
ncbi:MAG: cytochrome-c oxidase, cbb3-type subunit III [Sphingomonadaceae bacterium]